MKGRKVGLIGIIILALAMVFSFNFGCVAPAPEEVPQKVKIGHLVTFTGDLSFIGVPWENSSKLAVDGINAAGGVLGGDVEVIAEDTATESKSAVDATEKLIKIDKVRAISGASSTFGSMAVYKKAAMNKVLMISPSATAATLTPIDDDDFFFRTCPSDTLQAAALGKLAWEKEYRTVNVISRNDDYGIGLEKVFTETFEGLGGKVPVKVRYDPKAPDYSGYLTEVSSKSADVILLNGLMEDGTRMLKKAHGMGVTESFKFLLNEGVQNPEIPGKVGIEVTAGMGGATPYPAKAGAFPEDYEARFGEEPMAYCANVYDNFNLIALATQKAGKYDGTAIRDNLRDVANPPGVEVTDIAEALKLVREGKEINYQGAGGEITFDENGDIIMKVARVWKYNEEGMLVYTGKR